MKSRPFPSLSVPFCRKTRPVLHCKFCSHHTTAWRQRMVPCGCVQAWLNHSQLTKQAVFPSCLPAVPAGHGTSAQQSGRGWRHQAQVRQLLCWALHCKGCTAWQGGARCTGWREQAPLMAAWPPAGLSFRVGLSYVTTSVLAERSGVSPCHGPSWQVERAHQSGHRQHRGRPAAAGRGVQRPTGEG